MSVFPLSRAVDRVLAVCTCLVVSLTLVAQQSAPATPNWAGGDGSASVALVLDNSQGSRNSFDALRNGAEELNQAFGTRDEVALFLAGGKPQLAQDFTGDTSLLHRQLRKAKTTGGPALVETLAQAVDHARSDSANDRIAVVAFTGDLTTMSSSKAAALESKFREKGGVPVYIVAYGKTDWHSQEIAQRLAVLSGGAAFFPKKGGEVTSVAKVLATKLGAAPHADAANNDRATEPSLQNYKVVVVHDIPVSQNDHTANLPGGNNLLLHQVLVARLKKAKVFPDVREVSGNISSSDDPPPPSNVAPNELELLPMVVDYRGGVRGPKDFVAPFASPRLTVQVVMRDRNSREAIGSFTEEASGAGGLFRGSEEKVQTQAIISVSDKIISHLKKLQKSQPRK